MAKNALSRKANSQALIMSRLVVACVVVLVLGATAIVLFWPSASEDSSAVSPSPVDAQGTASARLQMEQRGARLEGSEVAVEDAPAQGPSDDAWFEDKRASIPVQGQTTADVLRAWHGELLDELIDIHGYDQTFFDMRRPEGDYLGDPIACLDGALAELLMQRFDSQWAPSVRTFLTQPSAPMASQSGWRADPIRECAKLASYNPARRALDADSDEYRDASRVAVARVAELSEVARQYLGAARDVVAGQLSVLSPDRLPEFGYIFFGPFWGPAHPHSGFRGKGSEALVYIASAGGRTSCGSFAGSYVLDLAEVPGFASQLATIQSLRSAVRQELATWVQTLPAE